MQRCSTAEPCEFSELLIHKHKCWRMLDAFLVTPSAYTCALIMKMILTHCSETVRVQVSFRTGHGSRVLCTVVLSCGLDHMTLKPADTCINM